MRRRHRIVDDGADAAVAAPDLLAAASERYCRSPNSRSPTDRQDAAHPSVATLLNQLMNEIDPAQFLIDLLQMLSKHVLWPEALQAIKTTVQPAGTTAEFASSEPPIITSPPPDGGSPLPSKPATQLSPSPSVVEFPDELEPICSSSQPNPYLFSANIQLL